MKDNLIIPEKKYTYEYGRKSVTQEDRLGTALSQDYVGLDERSFEDLFQQLKSYAKNVVFYDETTPKTKEENQETWETFFEGENGPLSMAEMERNMNASEVNPQLALMLAFLKLYQIEQDNFNGLLTRYHDFYYKDILGFTPQKGYVGKTVVFPAIEKQVENVLIPKGTLFDAGRDSNGKPLYYATSEDFSVNQVKVSDCVAYNNLDDEEEVKSTDSEDAQPQQKPYFQPICGEDSEQVKSSSSVLSDKYGVAICSDKFLSQDGTLHVSFKEGLNLSDFEVEYTGEKGWVKSDNSDICIDQTKNPIVPYDKKIHGEGYDTESPIIRLNAKKAKTIRELKKEAFYSIEVKVSGSHNVIIENKYGLVDNRVGAVVFGAQCAEDDYFLLKTPIDGATITSKKTEFVLDYYFGTHKNSAIDGAWRDYKWNPSENLNTYVLKNASLLIENDVKKVIINGTECTCTDDFPSNIEFVAEEKIFRYSLSHDEFNQQANALRLAKSAIDYQKSGTVGLTDYLLNIPVLGSPIEITYEFNLSVDDFQLYPTTPFGVEKMVVLEKREEGEGQVVTNQNPEGNGDEKGTEQPTLDEEGDKPKENEGVENGSIAQTGKKETSGRKIFASSSRRTGFSVSKRYPLGAKKSGDTGNNATKEATALAAEGGSETNEPVTEESVTNVENPTIPNPPILEGENFFSFSSVEDMGENYLQIGLEGVTKPCVVSLYFRINSYVLDGHYIPRWYYISEDKEKKKSIWTKMSGNVLNDSTNSFRQSGCVTLSLDEDIIASEMNQTSFPQGKIWLKLNFKREDKKGLKSLGDVEVEDIEDLDEEDRQSKMNEQNNEKKTAERFDFSAIEEVRAQGLEVEYAEESRGILPCGTVLKAGSIKKLVVNINGIKKIDQPYDGAMGRSDEDEVQFRSRVSEKLRHKGKAWSGWDYERLILENFPQIAAAKYLPCRNLDGNYKAGHVYVLLAPNPQMIEQKNPLKPNIGSDLLYDIYQCVKAHATTFAQQEFHVKALQYEEILVKCEIRLKEGLLDADYYETLINQELVRFLAPWSDNSKIVDFSVEIEMKDILYFIENLDCVELVESLGLGCPDNQEGVPTVESNTGIIRPSKVTHILTSAAKHEIKVSLFTKKKEENNDKQ
ncbi:MAG: hypothetical protein J6Y37_01655 [Paludibacteraceae bacterium]|nr:hypothetical protein [Paludibacteraceae bacterium]